MKHHKTAVFFQISKCHDPLYKWKAALLMSFWGRFCCYTKLFISHLFNNNGKILTPSMISHS